MKYCILRDFLDEKRFSLSSAAIGDGELEVITSITTVTWGTWKKQLKKKELVTQMKKIQTGKTSPLSLTQVSSDDLSVTAPCMSESGDAFALQSNAGVTN